MKSNSTPLETLKDEVINDVLNYTNSKKIEFTYTDAVKYSNKGKERTQLIIKAIKFLESNPLSENDYFKFLDAYTNTGIKLKEKYFRHDLIKLNNYYKIADKKANNPFNKVNYETYILFMFLKLFGHFTKSDNLLFNVKSLDNREYNPLTKIPSVLRGCLPFEVKEYDIKRAFPTFIDIELNSEFRTDVYEKIDKSSYAMFLNSNCESKVSIEDARKGLLQVYKERVSEVLTDARYKEKGKLFKDLTAYEKQYIDRFVLENEITNYVRLHDGIFVLKETDCKKIKFDTVEFSIKECIKPMIENKVTSFYHINEKNEVVTSPAQYADFLKQEKFIRLSTPDDKIQLLKNTNSVVDFFNHKTDMVSFLESEINEVKGDKVRDKIARDNNNSLSQSYTLLKPIELIYYKDSKERFGLPFKNGFKYFDDIDKFEIKSKSYEDVKGFFAPHPIQKREFNYTDEVGNFELFIQRISTGLKDYDKTNIEKAKIVNSFNSMVGYLCHNYKSFTESPCIILTDEGANDENRNGGRGKTAIANGASEVTKTLKKGGNEFVGGYIHNFADLDKSYNLYLIDDIPAGFNQNDLYTNITEGINVQPKGSKGNMIEKEDTPKFLITSNWLLRYDENNTSTNRRFIEYKIKPYYGISHTPKDEFKQTFFQDWDKLEWNKFYSYIFRCVHSYLTDGLQRIHYDKTEDNYKAVFNSDAKESEMARIINVIINHRKQTSLNVSDFLSIYNAFENPLRKERLFSHVNTKELTNNYLPQSNHKDFNYNTRVKRWEKR